jgi:hypothetical protein
MKIKLLPHYRATLSTIIRHYKSYGIIALFSYYILIGLILVGLPVGAGLALGWLLQTNQGWPAILIVILFLFVTLPRIPILVMVLFLIFEWMFNISRLNRFMDIPDYALRQAIEKWSSRSSDSKHNSNTGIGSSL